MRSFANILVTLVLVFCFSVVRSQVALQEQSMFLDSVIQKFSLSPNNEDFLAILNQQIDIKNSLVAELKFQIVQLDKDIKNNEIRYDNLNAELNREKKIYADLILRANRLRNMMYENFDIFSIDNLYKTYRQFLYIKWMSDYRKKKILRINKLKSDIVELVNVLEKHKTQRNLLAEKLGAEKSFIQQYSSRRSLILNDITKKHNVVDDRVEYNNLDSIKNSRIQSSKCDKDSSYLFEVQKGYLIWPVHKAVIINSFGEKQHPVYEKVTVKNDGLDFCVPSSSKVRCVYNGVVAKITLLPNNKYIIIVRHGTFFTVYNGLDNIDVSLDDVVEKQQEIGGFNTSESHSVFNFQIWKGTESLDPSLWLVKSKK